MADGSIRVGSPMIRPFAYAHMGIWVAAGSGLCHRVGSGIGKARRLWRAFRCWVGVRLLQFDTERRDGLGLFNGRESGDCDPYVPESHSTLNLSVGCDMGLQ